MKTLINSLYLIIIVFLFLKCASAPQIVKIEDKKIAVPEQRYSAVDIELGDIEIENQNGEIIRDSTILFWEGDLPGAIYKLPAKARAKFNKTTDKLDLEVIVLKDTISAPDTNAYLELKKEAKTEFRFWAYWILGVLVLIVIILFVWKSK